MYLDLFLSFYYTLNIISISNIIVSIPISIRRYILSNIQVNLQKTTAYQSFNFRRSDGDTNFCLFSSTKNVVRNLEKYGS